MAKKLPDPQQMQKIIIPLIRTIIPNVIAANIIGVQPMSLNYGFGPWVTWFAWRPVKLRSGNRVWLKGIYRRTVINQNFGLIFTLTMRDSRLTKLKRWINSKFTGKQYEYDDDFGILKE